MCIPTLFLYYLLVDQLKLTFIDSCGDADINRFNCNSVAYILFIFTEKLYLNPLRVRALKKYIIDYEIVFYMFNMHQRD